MVRLGAITISDLSLQGTAFYRDHAMEGGPLSPPQRHVMSSNGVHACAVGVDDVVIHLRLHRPFIVMMLMTLIMTATSICAALHLRMP